MLNRRILRVKAMQSLYSYYVARSSQRQVIKQQLLDKYQLDPAIHDFSDKPIFEKRQEALSLLFDGKMDDPEYGDHHDLEEEIKEDAKSFIEKYETKVKEEQRSIRKNMLEEINQLSKMYFKILLLPGEFSFLELQDKEKREKASLNQKDWNYNLAKNPVIDALTSFPPILQKAMNEKLDWNNERDDLKYWYREILKTQDFFIEYQKKKKPSREDHKQVIQDLFKKVIFKNEAIDEYFMERDLHWSENKATLRSLVTKTVKSYEPDLEDSFEIMSLSKNLEDDLNFFKKLYDETIARDEKLSAIISKKTKNWDVSRIAMLDKIILKMALSEMIVFPSIPVKVTINEFIELSKNYSTPKSKQFVNGILDVLSNELTSEGVIRKSGRGLIDNK